MKPKTPTLKQSEALRHIRNWIMHKGTTPSVRELMIEMKYKSPRSAAIIINELIEKGFLKKKSDRTIQLVRDDLTHEHHARTINVPLVGSVACGVPILAQENTEALIPISIALAKPGGKYFLLRAEGDSMNAVNINSGDLVLIRQQPSADNGNLVVALIDDQATIKEFHLSKGTIVLYPRSKNPKHKPIVLTKDFQIQGIVVATIPNLGE